MKGLQTARATGATEQTQRERRQKPRRGRKSPVIKQYLKRQKYGGHDKGTELYFTNNKNSRVVKVAEVWG